MAEKNSEDICVRCGGGIVNVRAGAIIIKDGKFLMTGNRGCPEYLYSVGGRIKFGETAEEAVKREVLEETGVQMEVDRLGFIHENYFYGDISGNPKCLVYEISFFFYMKVPEGFEPVCESVTQDGDKEFLCWVDFDSERKYYPEFLGKEISDPKPFVKHIVCDER